MDNSINSDHGEALQQFCQDEAIKTPLVVKNKTDSSFTELMFQFPTPSDAKDRKISESGRRSIRNHSSCKNPRTVKTFLTLPGPNSVTKFANAINSLPSPICPVSTPLPLTSIGKKVVSSWEKKIILICLKEKASLKFRSLITKVQRIVKTCRFAHSIDLKMVTEKQITTRSLYPQSWTTQNIIEENISRPWLPLSQKQFSL